jgi:phospholipid transport system transporter-binding protein
VSRAVIIARGDSSYAIEGVLDFDSVASLVAEGERMLSGSGRIDVDLGAIREANSAGLALVLEWMDMARRRRRDLRLHNLPESLMRLASLANVSGLLPLADA